MTEPISDEELQDHRDALDAYDEVADLHVDASELRGIIARLDAAEARIATLESERDGWKWASDQAMQNEAHQQARVAALTEALETMRRWYNEHPAKDKAAELWLQSQHSKDWYIGDATGAEWSAAYEWIEAALTPPTDEGAP